MPPLRNLFGKKGSTSSPAKVKHFDHEHKWELESNGDPQIIKCKLCSDTQVFKGYNSRWCVNCNRIGTPKWEMFQYLNEYVYRCPNCARLLQDTD
jgi:hypothetical protein